MNGEEGEGRVFVLVFLWYCGLYNMNLLGMQKNVKQKDSRWIDIILKGVQKKKVGRVGQRQLSGWIIVGLFSLGCYTRWPLTGRHKQEICISDSSRAWKSEIRVLAWLGSWWGLSSWLTDGCPQPSESSPGGERKLFPSSPYKGTHYI